MAQPARTPTSFIVIPARLASTRLPRKLLLRETGKSLIRHTFEAACRAKKPAGVCVATDDEEIAAEVRSFGGRVFMTSPACASGTDRIAAVASQLPQADILVNVQGDEPEISGEVIDAAVEVFEQDSQTPMSTLAAPLRERSKLDDPACVKVVIARGRALYFSRAAIPHAREWSDALLLAEPPSFYQHLGLYAYRREFLLEFAKWPRTPLERLENLEQLRVLEHGHSIRVALVDEATVGIDTADDYRQFVRRMAARAARMDAKAA